MTTKNPNLSSLLGQLGIPGMFTPTLDVDELEKKIKDLKAVEGWLSMNLSMLQMSIQGLEVQRNTLLSIRAVGDALKQGAADEATAASETTHQAGWPWNLMAQMFQPAEAANPSQEVAPETSAEPKPSPAPKRAKPQAKPKAASAAKGTTTAANVASESKRKTPPRTKVAAKPKA